METFDVYLKNRLTEIDVTISQLVQRDTFSMYDYLTLTCSMSELEILKSIAVSADMRLAARVDETLKIAHEKIQSGMQLEAEAELLNVAMAEMNAGMVIDMDETGITEKSFAEVNNNLELSADRLDYYIAHSIGRVSFDSILSASTLDTGKKSIEQFASSLELSAQADFSGEKHLGLDDIDLTLDVGSMDIFYLLTTGARDTFNLSASPIDEYILKKVLNDLASRMTINAEGAAAAIKYIENFSDMTLAANLTDVLISFISPMQCDMSMSCEASIGLKRYRLLSEMDDLTLADLDDSTLNDLDFVILAE